MPIIKSLLDTDLYKFTMGQVALHQFPWVNAEYEFKCRNQANWTKEHVNRIREEVLHFCSLRFTEDELDYLRGIRFFKDSFVDFLKLYQPDIRHFDMGLHTDTGELYITVNGPWFLTVFWEVPLLAIVNEVYFENKQTPDTFESGTQKIRDKVAFSIKNPFPFVDFGTRRRFSGAWHESVLKHLMYSDSFKGTSNVHLAKKLGLTPIGTMAHEFLQVGQALDAPLIDSQKRMLQAWVDEYRGDLGIALTDIVGFDAFLADFDLYFAKLYDGLRHDSGEPTMWASKAIQHYVDLGIDPRTKTLVFSDGLNMQKAADLHKAYSGMINVSFGIGTNLTNDFDTITPLQIVMKIVECNGRPVAKISDSPGKGMCRDPEYIKYLKKVFQIKD